MRYFAIIMVAVLLPLVGRGQAVAHLGADTIALGDQTTLVVRNAFAYPSAEALSQGGVLALGQQFDTATRTQTTVLTSFEPGTHVIRLSDDDSLLLTVTSPVIDSADATLRDIAPIERVPYTFWEVFRWVLLVLAVGGVAFGIWWLVRHRQRLGQAIGIGPAPEPVDTRTPFERATQALEALRQRGLWQGGHVKAYYTELTDIVRRFIEEATQVNATDLTSDETVEAVDKLISSSVDTAKGLTEQLRSVFGTADMVKFAKSEPLPHEHDRAMQQARAFVEGLWQLLQPAAGAEEGGKEAKP